MATKRQGWSYNDSGILRKKEEDEELLVFGYSCKLFRDDEKALFIDQGKHLIPWMGDETLKIDRYDGRGTLMDLRLYEPPPGGFDAARGLSESERRVEQLCDEERYRALQHNEEEEALYQEEELKRLHRALDNQASYGQVAFNYDNEAGGTTNEQDTDGEKQDPSAEEDEAFIVPPELDVPVNMVLPETVKLNAIIEKTALFISHQGAQMEILLKMKQANNPQFSFLSFDDPLHAYYRHLLMAIKTGRYRPKAPKNEEAETDGTGGEEHYLHPSLAPTTGSSRLELAPSIPSIAYKPSADCAYSLLVNKIRTKQVELGIAPASPSQGPTARLSSGMNDHQQQVQQQYQQHYSAVPDQEAVVQDPSPEMILIIDKMASYVAKNGRAFEDIVRARHDSRFMFLDASHHWHSFYEDKIAHHTKLLQPPKKKKKKKKKVELEEESLTVATVAPRPDDESEETQLSEEKQPPPPGETEMTIGPQLESTPSEGTEVEPQEASSLENTMDVGSVSKAEELQEQQLHVEQETESNKQESEERQDNDEKRPEPEVEEESESQLSQRNSDRSSREESPNSDSDKEGQSRKPAPVCFSIKKPREMEGLLEMRSALPVEESSDEEETEEVKKPEPVKKVDPPKILEPVKRIEPSKRTESSRRPDGSRRLQEHAERRRPRETSERDRDRDRIRDRDRDRERERDRVREHERKRAASLERRRLEGDRKRPTPDRRRGEPERKRPTPDRRRIPPEPEERKLPSVPEKKAEEKRGEAEVIDLTGDVTEEKKPTVDKDKWAEERLKDRLAAAAREKIAAAAREKQLQLERKRRAAAFLNMIRKDNQLPTTTVMGPTLPDGCPVQRVSADEDEISSIPSPTSTDVPSPPSPPVISSDRNATTVPQQQLQQPSSLLARLQAQQELKRRAMSHSPSHSPPKLSAELQGHTRHKHKRKKETSSHHSSRHKKGSSPHRHRHKHEDHEKSKKLKKKDKERTLVEPSSRHKEKRKKHHKNSIKHHSSESSSS